MIQRTELEKLLDNMDLRPVELAPLKSVEASIDVAIDMSTNGDRVMDKLVPKISKRSLLTNSVNKEVGAYAHAKMVNSIVHGLMKEHENPYESPANVTAIRFETNQEASLAYHNSLQIRKNSLFSKLKRDRANARPQTSMAMMTPVPEEQSNRSRSAY